MGSEEDNDKKQEWFKQGMKMYTLGRYPLLHNRRIKWLLGLE